MTALIELYACLSNINFQLGKLSQNEIPLHFAFCSWQPTTNQHEVQMIESMLRDTCLR